MKHTQLFTVIVFLIFGMACNNPSQHGHPAENQQSGDEAPEAAKIGLTLNNGAKWAADNSTYGGMKQLELSIHNFTQSHTNPSLEDYHQLGEALASINTEIIRQCSMQGKDHDQLHLLLEPMLQNVDVIKKGNDTGAAAKNLLALEKSLAMFFAHFTVE